MDNSEEQSITITIEKPLVWLYVSDLELAIVALQRQQAPENIIITLDEIRNLFSDAYRAK
jgi:hypothetical protein